MDYKSTIITSPTIRTALNINPDTAVVDGKGNLYWNTIDEKDTNGNLIRYSDAVDEIQERMAQEREIINNATIEKGNPTQMIARTASFIVGVEFENINSASNVYLMDSYGNVIVDGNGDPIPDPNIYEENKNVDFGIILRPIVDLSVDKTITYMSIQLANGQILASGDPRTDDLPYTRAVDDSIFVDMDADLIQGASLNMRYDIEIRNSSEVDYQYSELDTTAGKAGRRYYYFGDRLPELQKTEYINLVGDYLDEEVYYELSQINQGLTNGWKETTAIELQAKGSVSKEAKDKLIAGKYNVLTTTEFNEGLGASSTPSSSTSKTISFGVTKLLGTKSELVFTNDVEILELHGSARRITRKAIPGNLIPSQAKECDEDSVHLTIMPPTGANKNYVVYVTIAIGALVAIGVGAIFIRKRFVK